jgi:hypothetical protein
MKTKSLSLTFLICFTYVITASFQAASPLQGVWEYEGGKYNKWAVNASKETKLTKMYTPTGYQVLTTNKSGKVIKNEAGTYSIKNNILTETQTSGTATSSLKSKIMLYTYSIQNNKLTIIGKLTNKWPVEEYWKKIK